MKYVYESLCFVVLLMFAGSAFASENPLYSANTSRLTINAVDAENQPGIFQDVVIEFARDDLWRLVNMREGVLLPHIQQVDLVQINSQPVQVFLRIRGQFPSGCGAIGEISQQQVSNKFTLSVYYKNDAWLQNPDLIACTMMVVGFSHVIPLQTYGLAAGSYEYTLNNKFNGVFVLQSDNVLTN
jgi:hypothetical protein